MRRCLTKLSLFLLVGTITNLIVAWGFDTFARMPSGQTQPIPADEARKLWSQSAPRDWKGSESIGTVRLTAFGASVDCLTTSIDGLPFAVTEYRVGWPLPTLMSRCLHAGEREHWRWAFAHHDASWTYFRPSRILPWRPLWRGMAINTFLFAGAAFAIVTAPAVCMWLVRRIRVQCPACGYPIGSSPRCTECGRPVVSRDTATDAST
jgi:hypothetical protein